MIFGQDDPTPHNHQASDGYDYEGCPACQLEAAVRDLWGDLPADQVRQLLGPNEDPA